MAFVFTQLVSYPFTGANESPLNPAEWHSWWGGLPGKDVLEVFNHVCTTTDQVLGDGGATNIAINWTPVPDQFLEFELSCANPSEVLFFYLRGQAADFAPCYRLTINNSASPEDTGFTLDAVAIGGGSTSHIWVDFQRMRFNNGDKIRFGVLGQSTGHLYVYVNNALIFQGALADDTIGGILASGSPGMQLSANTPLSSEVGITNFRAGSMSGSLSYSIPDDRNYGNFPNTYRDLQGTLIYDTPSVFSLRYWFNTLFNRTEPLPLDSRASVPVDSRTSSTTPQNSRTPPA